MTRIEKSLLGIIGGLVIVLAIAWLAWDVIPAQSPDELQAQIAAPVTPQPTIDKSPKLQAGRKELIEKMIELEVFMKVVQNGQTMPRAWIGKAFHAMPFDEKVKAATLVYAYYFDGSRRTDSVAIVDGYTGKEIGRFDLGGLNLD